QKLIVARALLPFLRPAFRTRPKTEARPSGEIVNGLNIQQTVKTHVADYFHRSPNKKIWRLVSASKFSIAAAEAPSGISLSNSKKRAEFSLRAAVSITVTAAWSRRARLAARTCKPVKTSAPIRVMVETRFRRLAKSRC